MAISSTDPERVISHRFPETTFSYTESDVAQYALGIRACGMDPLDEDELKYVYHEDGQQFIQALPTFDAIFPFKNRQDIGDVQGLKFDRQLLLHGQQYMEIYKPLPTRSCVKSKVAIAGKVTIVEIETTSYDKRSGEALFMNRLSGDYNPLHSDPKVANIARFERPILHGLCTYGFAVRAVIKCFCNGEVAKVKSIFGRFILHVYPGETLIAEMWTEGSRVIYRTKVKERDQAVLSGYVVLRHIPSSL